MLQDSNGNNIEEYKRLRTKTRKLMKRKKKELQTKQIEEIEQHGQNRNITAYYKGISLMKKGYQPRTENFIRKDNGQLVTECNEVKETWRDYFCQLLNPESNDQPFNSKVQTAELPDTVPTFEEVQKAISKLKNNKAPGSDKIPAECIKCGGETLYQAIHHLIEAVWNAEEVPREWKEGVIVPIFKKGDRMKCSNYRGITLLNTAYKVFSNILLEKLKPYAEEIIGDYQCGFRRGRSTIDQIFTIKQIMEKCWEFNRNLHQLFIDFKQAYDTIRRVKLWQAMEELGFPKKLVKLTQVCINGSMSRVRIAHEFSEVFNINDGLKQGDALSPLLFNVALEYVSRKAEIQTPTAVFHGNGPKLLLAFADDIDIVGNSTLDIKSTLNEFEKGAGSIGLKINEEKTKYMYTTRNEQHRDRLGQNITMDDYNFERVKKFKYLGTTLTENTDGTEEINCRIQAGNRCLYAVQDLLKSKLTSRRSKISVYKTIIRPVVMYGCETWTLTVTNEERLRVFERKVLRKIYGPIVDPATGQYRIRTNKELEDLYGDSNIIREIKSKRLKWAGHVRRLPDGRTVKLAWEEAPQGKRPLGRPRLRWKDNIAKDLRAMNVDNPLEVMEDRRQWRAIVKSAKTHAGL